MKSLPEVGAHMRIELIHALTLSRTTKGLNDTRPSCSAVLAPIFSQPRCQTNVKNSVQLENRLHQAKEEAPNLCAADQSVANYKAFCTSNVRLHGLMDDSLGGCIMGDTTMAFNLGG